MNWMNKMERKFGKYAIRNLSALIIALYAAGYILSVTSPRILSYLTLEPFFIFRGELWRIVTWIIVPPGTMDLFTVIMLFFYFSIGRTLERTWGEFRFNFYILSGIIFTVLGAFLLYAIGLAGGRQFLMGGMFSTYYINMSIFLAFALTYPNMEVLLYFIIPIKVKWMGVLYGVLIIYSFMQTNWAGRVAIIASLLNFILFFLLTRNMRRISPKEIKRKQDFKKSVHMASPKTGTPIHRCAVCGRTEADGENLVFRYCSKCDGAYEYCQDHLFTHEHVRKPDQ